jgi:hypothetical protein
MWKKRKKKWRPKTVTIRRLPWAVSLARFSSSCLLIVFLFYTICPCVLPAAIAAPIFGGAASNLKPGDPYALIFGTVWDPDGRPVYGITVKIRRATDKRAKWELYSDHSGEFAQRVPAGKADYVVWADLKGVKTADGQKLHLAQEVDVHVEYDERVDIGLHLTR